MVSYALLLQVLVETFQEHLVSYNVMRGQCLCMLLGRHGSVSLCRDERENKMAATYNVLAFKR